VKFNGIILLYLVIPQQNNHGALKTILSLATTTKDKLWIILEGLLYLMLKKNAFGNKLIHFPLNSRKLKLQKKSSRELRLYQSFCLNVTQIRL